MAVALVCDGLLDCRRTPRAQRSHLLLEIKKEKWVNIFSRVSAAVSLPLPAFPSTDCRPLCGIHVGIPWWHQDPPAMRISEILHINPFERQQCLTWNLSLVKKAFSSGRGWWCSGFVWMLSLVCLLWTQALSQEPRALLMYGWAQHSQNPRRRFPMTVTTRSRHKSTLMNLMPSYPNKHQFVVLNPNQFLWFISWEKRIQTKQQTFNKTDLPNCKLLQLLC